MVRRLSAGRLRFIVDDSKVRPWREERGVAMGRGILFQRSGDAAGTLEGEEVRLFLDNERIWRAAEEMKWVVGPLLRQSDSNGDPTKDAHGRVRHLIAA